MALLGELSEFSSMSRERLCNEKMGNMAEALHLRTLKGLLHELERALPESERVEITIIRRDRAGIARTNTERNKREGNRNKEKKDPFKMSAQASLESSLQMSSRLGWLVQVHLLQSTR